MAYTKNTNFTAKDALASGNPSKIIKGSELDTEFDEIATEDALSAKLAGTNVWTGTQEFQKIVHFKKGADVASATALPLITDGNYFDVTGTTTITSFNTTNKIGTVVKLHFDGALTLTHHATDLILPGGANITTAAGDEAEFVEYAAGDFRCTSYTKADGTAVASSGITLGTPVATTSGTAIDFTGIPSGTLRVKLVFDGVSSSSTSNFLVQIGDSGGVETSGYVSSSAEVNSGGVATSTATTGFIIDTSHVAAGEYIGVITLLLQDSSDNTWVSTGMLTRSGGTTYPSSGNKALSAELDRIRLTTYGGSDTFDAGKINIQYES